MAEREKVEQKYTRTQERDRAKKEITVERFNVPLQLIANVFRVTIARLMTVK